MPRKTIAQYRFWLPDQRAALSLSQIEVAVNLAMGGCILLIGVVTGQLVTHLIESLPVWVLAVCPRRPWTRATIALTAFAWIFMLVAMTPEFRHALQGGNPARPDFWLAPSMVLLCLASLYLNLSLLRGQPLNRVSFGASGVLLVSTFYLVNHFFMEVLLTPLERVVAGEYSWAVAIVASSFVALTAGLGGVRWWTGNRDLQLSRAAALRLAAFWGLFLGAMIVSQLPGIKNY